MRTAGGFVVTGFPALYRISKRLIYIPRVEYQNRGSGTTMATCPNCGKSTPEGKFCEHCGASMQTTQTFQQPAAQPVFTPQPVPARADKSGGIAAILSFLFTGSGQVYNGQLGKGIGILICAIIGYMLYFIPGMIVWIYGMYDAYSTANKMNTGEIPYVETSWGAVIAFIVVEIILAVIFFLVVLAAVMGSSGYYY